LCVWWGGWVGRGWGGGGWGEGIKKFCVGHEGEIQRNTDAGVVNMKERI
jgi:hypothetical protein